MAHKDSTCPIGVLPGERFFSSGNERTPTSFGDVLMTSPNKIKSAFPLKPADTLFAQFELMNITPAEKRGVYLVVELGMVFHHLLQTKRCGSEAPRAMAGSDITGLRCLVESGVPAGKRVFDYGWSWTSNFNGDMLGVGRLLHFYEESTPLTSCRGKGILHDGGSQTGRNSRRTPTSSCASKPTYKVGGHSHKKRSTGLSRRDGL